MRKLSALVVIAALLCSGTAFAMAWDWDVTCRFSTHDDYASIPDGYWFYEYAWEMVANDRGDGNPSTPSIAHVWVGSAPGILLNSSGFDSEAPDTGDYTSVPAFSSLGNATNTDLWLQGLGLGNTFTGGYWLKTPGAVMTSTEYGRVVGWSNFTIDWDLVTETGNADDPGLAFYTSFLAPRPPRDVPWSIDDGASDGGTVCGPTPEPVSAVLLLLGLPAAAALRKRRE